jgi:endonuclease YncB( thermonuclease family)
MLKPTRRAACALLLALLSVSAALATEFTGRVVGISDGDTITVLTGAPIKVRLAGIDCPEKRQPFGQKAKEFISDLAYRTVVTVRVVDRDRYGRSVGEVILMDGKSLNRELVRAGFAWWYRAYSKDETLGALEAEARAYKRGL